MIQIKKINNFNGQNENYKLAVFEEIPFETKRIYYLNNIKSTAKTGAHAHKIEKEFFIILKGNATILLDEGNGLKEFNLNEHEAVFVDNLVWHQFTSITEGSIVLALSSTHYKADRSDYIEDYNEFKQIKK